jgi:nucleoside-diphosphate-sugar epimerase
MSHVIFGTGGVGMAVMETLVGRGEQVRMIDRTGSAEVPVGVDVLGGDASDPEFVRRVAAVRRSSIRRSIRPIRSGRSCSRRSR